MAKQKTKVAGQHERHRGNHSDRREAWWLNGVLVNNTTQRMVFFVELSVLSLDLGGGFPTVAPKYPTKEYPKDKTYQTDNKVDR